MRTNKNDRNTMGVILVKGRVAAEVFFFFLLACALMPAGCAARKAKTPPPPPKITVTMPVRRQVTYYLEATGTTQPVNTVRLVARVSGYLEKVFFRDGQMVKKGQLLFLIQQNTYLADLRRAEGAVLADKALLTYAQSQLFRYSHLYPEKAAAKSDVDDWRYQRDSARANLKQAMAELKLARLDLSYTRVTAPFDGRIDRRLQDPGSLVGTTSSNTTLAQMDQIDPIYVYFNISDIDLSRLMESAHGLPGVSPMKWPFLAGLAGEEGYAHKGHLDFASISLSNSTGTLLMRGVLPSPEGKILPGLYARVRVPLETRYAFLVPAISISDDQEGAYVLIVDSQNIVERRSIKTGPLEGDFRVVEKGLSGDERVVLSALLTARPGSRVTPVLEITGTKASR